MEVSLLTIFLITFITSFYDYSPCIYTSILCLLTPHFLASFQCLGKKYLIIIIFSSLAAHNFLRSHKRLIHNRRILHTQKEHTQLFTTLSWSQFSFHLYSLIKHVAAVKISQQQHKKSFYRNFLIFISFLSTSNTCVCVFGLLRVIYKNFLWGFEWVVK